MTRFNVELITKSSLQPIRHLRHFNIDDIDVGLASLLLTLNRFHTLFWCFHRWISAKKRQLLHNLLGFVDKTVSGYARPWQVVLIVKLCSLINANLWNHSAIEFLITKQQNVEFSKHFWNWPDFRNWKVVAD